VHLSQVNLGEVYCIIQRERGREMAVAALDLIDQLPMHQRAVDRPQVLASSLLKANQALSYADAYNGSPCSS